MSWSMRAMGMAKRGPMARRRQLVGSHKHPSTIVDAWALQEWAEQHGVKRSSEIEYERLTTAT